jgi:hypothetical protein
MRKNYTFIDGRKDKFGNYQVLWSHGNYVYEIEDRTAGKKCVFEGDFEDAKILFQEVCEGY